MERRSVLCIWRGAINACDLSRRQGKGVDDATNGMMADDKDYGLAAGVGFVTEYIDS